MGSNKEGEINGEKGTEGIEGVGDTEKREK